MPTLPLNNANTVRPTMDQQKVQTKPQQHFEVPLQSLNSKPGAPPPQMNLFNQKGNWATADKDFQDYCEIIVRLEKLQREVVEIKFGELPKKAQKLYADLPEVDCHFGDSPLHPRHIYDVMKAMEISRDPSQEYTSMGTPESRIMPSLTEYIKTFPNWLFRFRPKGDLAKHKKGVADLV